MRPLFIFEMAAESLDQLFARFRPALIAEGVRRTGSPHDAEELAQDAFVTVARRRPSFDSPAAFLAWSRQTIRRHASDRLRRSRQVAAREPAAGRAGDPGDLIDLALRAAAHNPAESPSAVACFLMHTTLGTGLRYLTYVLEEPRSTLARRFDAMRGRMEGAAGGVSDPVEIVNRLCDNLVRERLMDPRPDGPEAAFSLSRDLTVAALSRWPAAQVRLATQAVRNLAYIFRRYPPTPALSREFGEWRRAMETSDTPCTSRLAARYMLLRCDEGAGRDEWRVLHDRMAADPAYRDSPSRITAAAFAEGWPTAASLLRSLFAPGRVRRSFYLSFLAAEIAMREGRPRVAARHLEDIVESYCPRLLEPVVERRRQQCRAAWRSEVPLVEERLPLLA